MLAYVFWHWKSDAVSPETYEDMARRFHASLEQKGPRGFQASHAFAIRGADWIPNGGPAYEDWYLLDGSASLDVLDRAAVSLPHQEPHDVIARAVAGGTGGLYRLRQGTALAGKARHAHGFRKPEGMTYPALYKLLEATTAAGAALWGRQMTLGPAREFCLHSAAPLSLPAPIEAATLSLAAIWP